MFYHYDGKLIRHRTTQKTQIQALVEISEYLNQKPFKELTRHDVSTEDRDPLHKWIGTYNLKHKILRQFFTWLNDPNRSKSQIKTKKKPWNPYMQSALNT